MSNQTSNSHDLNSQGFETIYDHGITDDEILEMCDGYPETREEYFEVLSHDSAMSDLFRLYRMRGQPEKSDHYLEQINDDLFRNQIKMMLKMRPCCLVHS